MEVNYMNWVYAVNLNEETITFYAEEISYKEMMEIMAKYVGYKLVLRPKPVQYTFIDYYSEMMKQADSRSQCSCNPLNGGSGICGCTLGGMWSTTCKHDG